MTPPPRLWPIYLGGFMGPFGGAMVNAMLPEMAAGLGTNLATAASAVTWYMLPFSALMLVSGTVGARLGLARAVRVAFLVYAAGSTISVLATSATPFLAGRAVQGAANAFTTPLLLALLAELVPPARLGHALGTYAAMAAAGQAFAPFVGGVAAGVDYRWAFGAAAVVAVFLAVVGPSDRGRPVPEPPSIRHLANAALARASVTGFVSYFSSTASMVLVALYASDRFGLHPAARGLVVATFGLAGFAIGRAFGRFSDRVGIVPAGVGALLALGVAVPAAMVAPSVALLVVAMAVAGVGGTGGRVLVNSLAVRSTPTNPAGATSIALAVSFLGTALVPVLVPLYHRSALLAGLVPLGLTLIGALVVRTARGSALADSR